MNSKVAKRLASSIYLPVVMAAASTWVCSSDLAFAADKKMGAKKEADKTAALEPSPTQPEAAVTLQSDVYYTWQPLQRDGDGSVAENISVFFTTLTATAKTEEEAKESLKQQLPAAQTEAIIKCKEDHQSKASCFKQRFNTLGGEFSKLDFSMRRQITANIEADCASIQGKCVGIAASEVVTAPTPVIVTTSGTVTPSKPEPTAVTGQAPAVEAAKKSAPAAPVAPAAPAAPADPNSAKPQPPEEENSVPFGL